MIKYFIRYISTYTIFSLLKPRMLNNKIGRHKDINNTIFMVKLKGNKFNKQNIKMSQIILNITVL